MRSDVSPTTRPPSPKAIEDSLEKTAHDTLGISPNAHGLIDTAEDAAAVAATANASTAVEPGLWLPWLLVRYPIDV